MRVARHVVRLPTLGAVGHDLWQAQQLANQRLLGGVVQQLGAGGGIGLHGGRCGVAQDGGASGVRVLDVIHRILAGLALGELDVEVDPARRGT